MRRIEFIIAVFGRSVVSLYIAQLHCMDDDEKDMRKETETGNIHGITTDERSKENEDNED